MPARKRARTDLQRLIIDRWIDGQVARAELDGEMVEVPRALLPDDATADTVMRVERAPGRVVITLDARATAGARRVSARLVAKLARRDRGGDVRL
ncbi:MAG TPA: hypothetical protein VJ812_15395 [Gemmatimonadaceae bacterium]|jgi:phage terminase large subunit-like protein|nr:hypothetical protein [Gemmatimonadaceae bacterium]